MRLFKSSILLSLIVSMVAFLGCKKEFGENEYGFEADSVYYAETDGILFVQIITDGIEWANDATI